MRCEEVGLVMTRRLTTICRTSRPPVKGAVVLRLVILVTAAFGLACSSTNSANPADTSTELEDQVNQARNAGVTVYWLGEGFDGGGSHFVIYPGADFTDATDSRYPGLSLNYYARTARGSARTGFQMYSEAGEGPQIMMDRAAAVRGASAEDVTVGNWPGKLFTLPSPSRPVNKLYLFVDLGDTVAIVQPASGTTGLPGEDSNPLIDKDLLIQVVAENLQPIPE